VSTIQDREYVNKVDKRLMPTPLGEVVNGLMMERFTDIIDVEFTANMEQKLDEVEEGKRNWKDVLGDFYGGFQKELEKAEADLEGIRIKVPDELSEEICDLCGKQMVVKSGRFGRFLACPGFPECTFTKPLVIEMPGKCVKCGSRLLKKTSRNGYTYYGCERIGDKLGRVCDFMTWDVPVKDSCPECGWTMFKKSGRGFKKPFCINEACSAFVPEEKRGGFRKKKTEETAEGAAPAPEAVTEEKPAKKTTKKAAAEKKTTAKKTTKKAAADGEEKPKKTAAKKTTTKKTTKKAAEEAGEEEA
jgi:DNA topoisomerase-1